MQHLIEHSETVIPSWLKILLSSTEPLKLVIMSLNNIYIKFELSLQKTRQRDITTNILDVHCPQSSLGSPKREDQ